MGQVDAFVAARILGCRPDEARQIIGGGHGDLATIERLAMTCYRCDEQPENSDSYWCTAAQAAREVFGMPAGHVRRLLDEDLLPFECHSSGVRLMRRDQVSTIANARLSERSLIDGGW